MKNIFKIKTLLIALFVGFIGMAFGTNLFAQGSGQHTVTITVNDDGSYNVEPYELVIAERASHVPIRFELSSSTYEFMNGGNNGFDIQPFDDNFRVNGLSNQNKRLHLIDFNKVPMDYYYTITLVDPATGRTLLIDPRIKNGGGGTT